MAYASKQKMVLVFYFYFFNLIQNKKFLS